jgi:Ca2+-transporting ATPase
VTSDGREIFSEQFPAVMRDRAALSDTLERLALISNAFIENPGEPQDRWRYSGSAIDKAILRSLVRAGIYADVVARKWPRLAEIPFHARRKFSASLNAGTTGAILTVLGAPEVITARCGNAECRETMVRRAGELAANGFRVLAAAYRPMPWKEGDTLTEEAATELIFDGLVVFSDPIRHDVKEMIRVAQQAGIRVIMATGDHANTAQYVGQQLGILSTPERLIEGAQLPGDAAVISDRYDVFARVTPEHKVRIVDGLKQQGHSVAMIGDGVNDAPSLLRADIGVAVGSGTEVAKEASDLVLLNDSFSIIVQAIRQGRIIFDNIQKVALFLLSCAFTEIVLITGCMLLGLPLPLLPVQILWVNIIEDVFPAIALAWDKGTDDVMRQPPRRMKTLFSLGIRRLIILFTVITEVALFAVYFWLLDRETLIHARTMVFAVHGITSLVYIFSVRSLSRPVWRINPFGNRYLVGAVLLGLALYMVALYVPSVADMLAVVPLTLDDWTIIGSIALLNVAVFELGKRLFLNGFNHQSA